MRDWLDFMKPAFKGWIYGGIIGAIAGFAIVWFVRGAIF